MKHILYTIAAIVLLSSCQMNNGASSSGNDKIAKNEKTVQGIYDWINKHDLSKPDSMGGSSWTEHQTMNGKPSNYTLDSLKRDLTAFIAMYPDVNIKTNYMIADSNMVMAQWTQSGTNSGETFWKTPATNKQVTVDGVDIFKFDNNGKITDHWGYWDQAGELTQLGHNPYMPMDSTMMMKDMKKKK